MTSLDVVVGGQYGSESKGRVTADLAKRRGRRGNHVVGVRVAGPNAGHVVLDDQGRRFALRQIPVALVADPDALGVIAAGSEIDLDVLNQEAGVLEEAGHWVWDRLLIDHQATLLDPAHRDREGGNDGPMQNRIGSTGKGVGAARADRIMRTARIAADCAELSERGVLSDTAQVLDRDLSDPEGAVLIEGTQGYGLGLHAGNYPYCTSSDARAIDFLAMAGVSPWRYGGGLDFKIWVVLRAYPIRVAGNSGPLAGETSWAELNLPEERTTVTNKVRRVGTWDPGLAHAAVRANGGNDAWDSAATNPVRIAVAMADQVFPEIAGLTSWDQIPTAGGLRGRVSDWLDRIGNDTEGLICSLGTGPASTIWLGPDELGDGPGTEPMPWGGDDE